MYFSESTNIQTKPKSSKRSFSSTGLHKSWYVLYTAPRAEKVAKRELELKGYEVFLPMTKVLRVWKNRQKKMIDHVLFPSYLFVHTEEKYLAEICWTNKVKTYIHCGGRPSVIDMKCIDGIKQMLDLNQEISVDHDFTEGEIVRIMRGPLTGYEGVLVRRKSKTKFGIHLKEINQTVLVEICTDDVEKIA